MKLGLLGRMSRLLTQSRIRLPRAPLRGRELRRGDFVEIGFERFLVMEAPAESAAAAALLRDAHGERFRLHLPTTEGGPWEISRNGQTTSVPAELLTVFSTL